MLVPVYRVFDRAPPAHHPAGTAVQRHAVATRRADGVMRGHGNRPRHVPRPRDNRPFTRWRIRHLQEGTHDGDRLTSDIDQGGQAIGFDEPVPGATAQITVQIGLQTGPHHRSRSGVEGMDRVLNRDYDCNVE